MMYLIGFNLILMSGLVWMIFKEISEVRALLVSVRSLCQYVAQTNSIRNTKE